MFIYNFFLYRPWIWVGWCWTTVRPTSNDRGPLLRLRAIKMFAAWNRNRQPPPPTNSTFLHIFSWSLISLTLFFLSQANAFPSSLISMLHMFTYYCVCLCATTMSRILFWLAKRQMIFLFYLFVVSIFFERAASALLGGGAPPRSVMKSFVSKFAFALDGRLN